MIVNNNENPSHSGYEPPTINQVIGNNQLTWPINYTHNNNNDGHMDVFPDEYIPFAGNSFTSQSMNPFFANIEQINYFRTLYRSTMSRNNITPHQNNYITYPNELTINEFRGSINQLRNNQNHDNDIEEVD
jgi:hypothetical protein